MQSLFRVVWAKRPEPGVIHYSDRGSQYCSYEYGKMLNQFGMKTSMSRKSSHLKNKR
jgi:putative transposase